MLAQDLQSSAPKNFVHPFNTCTKSWCTLDFGHSFTASCDHHKRLSATRTLTRSERLNWACLARPATSGNFGDDVVSEGQEKKKSAWAGCSSMQMRICTEPEAHPQETQTTTQSRVTCSVISYTKETSHQHDRVHLPMRPVTGNTPRISRIAHLGS